MGSKGEKWLAESVEVLRNTLEPQIFAAWIQPLSLSADVESESALADAGSLNADENDISLKSRLEKQYVIITAPNKFCLDHVKQYYENQIHSALQKSSGNGDIVLRYRVSKATKPIGSDRIPAAVASSMRLGEEKRGKKPSSRNNSGNRSTTNPRLRHQSTNLNEKNNFSNWVVGSCNQFAHAVSLQVAQNLGCVYNPLFVYGGVGLGKTHLASAIGNYCNRFGKNVLLVSSEVFVNELIAAIRANTMQSFREKFRSLDLLVVDDVQFLIGKERTQEEFFHTFNELHGRRKQIVLTSDKVPQELIGLEERLRTRFSSGLSADLQAPDYETRVAILSKKSEAAGLELCDEVIQFLAEKIDTNVRELEGALNRIIAFGSLHKAPITLELAQQAFQAFLPSQKREVTPDTIQEAIAQRFKVSRSDLLGKRRTQNIALARQVAMFLCRKLTDCSYPEIGALFGGRDHSTVIHACRTVEEKIARDSVLSSEVRTIERGFGGN